MNAGALENEELVVCLVFHQDARFDTEVKTGRDLSLGIHLTADYGRQGGVAKMVYCGTQWTLKEEYMYESITAEGIVKLLTTAELM